MWLQDVAKRLYNELLNVGRPAATRGVKAIVHAYWADAPLHGCAASAVGRFCCGQSHRQVSVYQCGSVAVGQWVVAVGTHIADCTSHHALRHCGTAALRPSLHQIKSCHGRLADWRCLHHMAASIEEDTEDGTADATQDDTQEDTAVDSPLSWISSYASAWACDPSRMTPDAYQVKD